MIQAQVYSLQTQEGWQVRNTESQSSDFLSEFNSLWNPLVFWLSIFCWWVAKFVIDTTYTYLDKICGM